MILHVELDFIVSLSDCSTINTQELYGQNLQSLATS